MKIYTFTPVSFVAPKSFWYRDTGLVCRSLQEMGVESKCVLLLPDHAETVGRESILRASVEQVRSADWWRAQHLDWVVAFTWSDPRYTSMVKAMRRAGIRVLLHLDRSTYLFRPYDPGKSFLVNAFYRLKDTILNILRNRHMMLADAISCSQPLAEACLNSWCFSSKLKEKFRPFPCPVASHFVYDGGGKEDRVVCVGRWRDGAEDAVKRPEFLRAVAERFVEQGEQGIFEIYGACGQTMKDWYAALPPEKKSRIVLKGMVPNSDLVHVYQRAKVSICTSRSEGVHTASAEALNCGASIVTSGRPTLAVLHWYIAMGGGTVSVEDTPESFAEAIHTELNRWCRGERAPEQIAARFNNIFHVDKSLCRIFGMDERVGK